MRIALVCLIVGEGSMAKGYRALRLAKYLGRAGHRVDLLCSGENSTVRDEHFGRQIEEPLQNQSIKKNCFSMRRLINRVIYWPDPARQWVQPVMIRLKEIFRDCKPDVIIISSPPHSIQLIGMLTAQKYGIPYVADLRDDWITNHRLRFHTPLHRYVASYYEQQMVRKATGVVLNTEIVKKRFRKRYPVHNDKFFTVTNGYDEDDFEASANIDINNDGRKTIAYTGGMYGNFLYNVFSRVVEELRGSGLDKDWRIITAGDSYAPKPEQRDVWTHLGMLTPQETAGLLCRSDILVAVMPPGEQSSSGTVPLKIYSYLRAGKPIMYFGERGSTTELLNCFPGNITNDRTELSNFTKWLERVDIRSQFSPCKKSFAKY